MGHVQSGSAAKRLKTEMSFSYWTKSDKFLPVSVHYLQFGSLMDMTLVSDSVTSWQAIIQFWQASKFLHVKQCAFRDAHFVV